MNRKPLVWKLFPVYLTITLVSVLAIGLYAMRSLNEFYYSLTEDDLAVRARLVLADLQRRGIALERGERLASAVSSLAKSGDVRVTVILPSGEVVADSQSDPARMANHADRPEIREAVSGRVGISRRPSTTLGVTMLYVAVPVENKGKVVAVLRAAQAAAAIDSRPAVIGRRVALAVLATAVLAGILSLVAARWVAGPLTALQHTATRFASGDFRSRAAATDTDELAALAESLNTMAARTEDQLREMRRQSAQQAAILSSMREGVLAVGDDDRILIINHAAGRLLDVTAESAAGRSIQEAVRNPSLQKFVERARGGQDSEILTQGGEHARGKQDSEILTQISTQQGEEEHVFRTPQGRFVQMDSADLRDVEGSRLGILVVLNDITQSRKLDEMRKEFVANVSHELKTPITAIKGYVETLIEAAPSDPDKTREFLQTVARQADRLDAIVDDLLRLAEIEQKADAAQIELQAAPIRPVLNAAIANCRPVISEHGGSVELDCPEDLAAGINPPLLERAVTNLVDNAAKYSPEGSQIRVTGERAGDEIAIHVADNGPGIDAKHIPRLFERFYRVDTARSRKLGGTGLGLAIVKHIAQAHGGRASVRSVPGEGSTFSIYLPITSF